MSENKKEKVDFRQLVTELKEEYGSVRHGPKGKAYKSIENNFRVEFYTYIIQYLIEHNDFEKEDFNNQFLKTAVVEELIWIEAKNISKLKESFGRDWQTALAKMFPPKPIDLSKIPKQQPAEVIVKTHIEKPAEVKKEPVESIKHTPNTAINLDDFPFDDNAPCHVIKRPTYDKTKNDQGLKVASNVQWDMDLLKGLKNGDGNGSK